MYYIDVLKINASSVRYLYRDGPCAIRYCLNSQKRKEKEERKKERKFEREILKNKETASDKEWWKEETRRTAKGSEKSVKDAVTRGLLARVQSRIYCHMCACAHACESSPYVSVLR